MVRRRSRAPSERFLAEAVEQANLLGIVVTGAQFGIGCLGEFESLHVHQFEKTAAANDPSRLAAECLVAQATQLGLGFGELVRRCALRHGPSMV